MASSKSPKSTHLPSPPASPPPSDKPTTTAPPATLHDLETALDALLASYLTLLDQYTTLRTELSSHFSSGFLSLAAANRNAASTLGPGRRFGEEGFDGRMRALRRVSITTTPQPALNGKGPETDLEEAIPAPAISDSPDPDQEDKSPASPPISFSFSFHQQNQNHQPPSSPSTNEDQPQKEKEHPQPPPPRDPLKWYTALPPPALRQTQTHFVASLEGPLAALLGVQAEMALLEDRVRRARRELENARGDVAEKSVQRLALIDDEGRTDEGVSKRQDALTNTQTQKEATARSSPSSSPLKDQLASRSRGGEPRSRVLKMQ